MFIRNIVNVKQLIYLLSVRTLISDTHYPEISGFQLGMRINTKPNSKKKMKQRENKMFLLAGHQPTSEKAKQC